MMLCVKCHYPLDGLAGRRCPECGAEFDPDDETTRASWHDYMPKRVLLTAARSGFVAVFCTMFLLANLLNGPQDEMENGSIALLVAAFSLPLTIVIALPICAARWKARQTGRGG